MKRKIFSILMSVVLCLVILPLGIFAQAADDYKPFKGSGTASDPYQISSDYHLRLLAELINNPEDNPEYRNCYYIQTADIDLQNKQFTPIGIFYGEDGKTLTGDAVFSGNYNGNYHSIYNLNIDYEKKYTGLFGRISNLEQRCSISNLNIYGDVSSGSSCVGGIVGEIGYGAIVENCSFTGNLNAADLVGGIVGFICAGGTITNCYFNGSITSDNSAGGIVATAHIGKNAASKDAVIKNNYCVGDKIIANTSRGVMNAIIDNEKVENSIIFENNYYLHTMAETGAPDGITGCTKLASAALKACADMLGSPFVDNTDETVNDGYPVFEWQSTPYQFIGNGTAEDPYKISSKEELEAMRDLVNSTYFNPIYGHAYYKQTADIDLQGESWIPIGLGYDGNDGLGVYNYTTRMFFGSYDGNRHSIHNLIVNQQWNDSGLFGFIRGKSAIVCNLAVDGSVSNAANCAGGIVGQPQYGAVIKNCAFIGDVSGEDYVGGISGYAWSGTSIINCYHNGNVSSEGSSGGIVGSIKFGSANSDGDYSVVENCYHANGTVTGTVCSGGIAGECVYYNGIDTTIDIKNCYFSAGTAATTTCENATSDNTLALPENLMKKLAEDLGSVYADNPDETLNNGYPVFAWQLATYGQGDINFDGKVSVADAVLLQGYLLCRFSFNETEYYAADLLEDGSVNVFDMVVMKRILIGQ